MGRLFGLQRLDVGVDVFQCELDVGGVDAGTAGVDDFDDIKCVTGVNNGRNLAGLELEQFGGESRRYVLVVERYGSGILAAGGFGGGIIR